MLYCPQRKDRNILVKTIHIYMKKAFCNQYTLRHAQFMICTFDHGQENMAERIANAFIGETL